jgi:hypothetical protein
MKMRIVSTIRVLSAIASAGLLASQFAVAQSPREHLSLDGGWKFHRFIHAGDNVIAVGVNNGAGQGGLNPNATVKIIGHASIPPWSRSLFNGLAQIIVQSTREAGKFKVAASAEGLAPATAVVQTKACAPRPSTP